MAQKLNVGFVPIRKSGKLPYLKEVILTESYIDYSKKEKSLEIKKSFVSLGDRILLVDEWIETGASMRCCMNLLSKLGATIVGLATISINYQEETKEWVDSGFVHFIAKDRVFYGESYDPHWNKR